MKAGDQIASDPSGPDPTRSAGERSIVVAPGIGRVLGMVGGPKDLALWISDRKANGDGFPGEYVVRLPRRMVTQV